jgi:hypothetical protein
LCSDSTWILRGVVTGRALHRVPWPRTHNSQACNVRVSLATPDTLGGLSGVAPPCPWKTRARNKKWASGLSSTVPVVLKRRVMTRTVCIWVRVWHSSEVSLCESESPRNLLSFFCFGLINNFAYVVFQAGGLYTKIPCHNHQQRTFCPRITLWPPYCSLKCCPVLLSRWAYSREFTEPC